jgi:hypothetical protein
MKVKGCNSRVVQHEFLAKNQQQASCTKNHTLLFGGHVEAEGCFHISMVMR